VAEAAMRLTWNAGGERATSTDPEIAALRDKAFTTTN
jgi:hypothetical protein